MIYYMLFIDGTSTVSFVQVFRVLVSIGSFYRDVLVGLLFLFVFFRDRFGCLVGYSLWPSHCGFTSTVFCGSSSGRNNIVVETCHLIVLCILYLKACIVCCRCRADFPLCQWSLTLRISLSSPVANMSIELSTACSIVSPSSSSGWKYVIIQVF